MTSSLDLLENQFPGKLLLSAQEVASVLGQKPKRLYDLIESEQLPFKVLRHGRLIGIPKVSLAKWLDGEISLPTEESAEPVVKRRGRRRKALIVMAFQDQLCAEWKIHHFKTSFEQLIRSKKGDRQALSPVSEALTKVEALEHVQALLGCPESEWATAVAENKFVLEFVGDGSPLLKWVDSFIDGRKINPDILDAILHDSKKSE